MRGLGQFVSAIISMTHAAPDGEPNEVASGISVTSAFGVSDRCGQESAHRVVRCLIDILKSSFHFCSWSLAISRLRLAAY